MYRKVQLVMLPTNEKANDWVTPKRFNKGVALSKSIERLQNIEYWEYDIDKCYTPQHLYILSDEEIKEGDWFIEFDLKGTRSSYCNKPFLCDIGNTENFILTKDNGNFPFPENCKKIIATNDKSLSNQVFRKDGTPTSNYDFVLPQLSNSFIEKYVEEYNKGNLITEVIVEYQPANIGQEIIQIGAGDEFVTSWKLKINPKDNTINIKPIKDDGNRENIKKIIVNFCFDKYNQFLDNDEFLNKWIEENL